MKKIIRSKIAKKNKRHKPAYKKARSSAIIRGDDMSFASYFRRSSKNAVLDPRDLFDSRILDYRVQTKKLGRVSYVNLDNAATTPPFACVEKGIKNYLTAYGSVHRGAGTKSKISTDVYEDSRSVIKEFVHAPKDDYVIFSGNTTGAINTAAYFFSFLEGKVAVSSIEHSSSWLPWIKEEGTRALYNSKGELKDMDKLNAQIQELGRAQVLRYSVDENFEFDLKEIEALLSSQKIKVLVLTASSNINGYCPDIKAIGKLAHKYGAWFLVDACQFVQHHPVNMVEMGIDFLVASGHKFYAPYGGGFLIGPKKFLDKFLPYQIGGGNLPYITEEGEFLRYKNQLAHDPGTPNAVGAVSMALALKKLKSIGLKKIETYEKSLARKAFVALSHDPRINVYVDAKKLTTVLPFNIKGMSPTDVAERLNAEYGIGVRAGSFCVYQFIRKLLGITSDAKLVSKIKRGETCVIPGLVRASISIANTEKDIDRFIKAVEAIAKV